MSEEFSVDDYVFLFGPPFVVVCWFFLGAFTGISMGTLFLMGLPFVLISLFYYMFKFANN